MDSIKHISRTSAVSSTNFGSIQYSSLQAALLVLAIYYVGEFFLHGFVHHNGWTFSILNFSSRVSYRPPQVTELQKTNGAVPLPQHAST